MLLFLGRTNAQCVQVLNAAFEPSCTNACDSGTPFTFTMEGQTSVGDNVVSERGIMSDERNDVIVGFSHGVSRPSADKSGFLFHFLDRYSSK